MQERQLSKKDCWHDRHLILQGEHIMFKASLNPGAHGQVPRVEDLSNLWVVAFGGHWVHWFMAGPLH